MRIMSSHQKLQGGVTVDAGTDAACEGLPLAHIAETD